MTEKTSPPVHVQILSLVAMVCFGLCCITKGTSFGFFSWWLILGSSCIVAAAFASFRVYEVCRDTSPRGALCGTGEPAKVKGIIEASNLLVGASYAIGGKPFSK